MTLAINKDNWVTYSFYLVILVFFLFLISRCPQEEDVTPRVRVKTVVDTVYFPKDTVLLRIPVVRYRTVHDTIWGIKDSLHVYENLFDDSLISGKITDTVYGLLLSSKMSYVPKFPKYINRIDSVFITTIIPMASKERSNFFGGIGVYGNRNSFDFSPMVGFSDKKGVSIGYGYKVLGKEHNVFLIKKF